MPVQTGWYSLPHSSHSRLPGRVGAVLASGVRLSALLRLSSVRFTA